MSLDNRYYTVNQQLRTFTQLEDVFFEEESKYFTMDNDAKILYGLLQKRNNLSIMNGWYDNQGRIFFFFKQEELRKKLRCGTEKMSKLMKQLESYGLLERKKQGLNKPDILYLLSPEIDVLGPENRLIYGEKVLQAQEHPGVSKIESQDFGKSKPKEKEIKQKEKNIKINNNNGTAKNTHIVEIYEEATNKKATTYTKNQLDIFVMIYGEEKVIHAITRNDGKSITINYVKKLLESWVNCNTIQEVENQIKSFNDARTKAKKQQRQPKVIRTELVPDWLKEEQQPKTNVFDLKPKALTDEDRLKIERMKQLQAQVLGK